MCLSRHVSLVLHVNCNHTPFERMRSSAADASGAAADAADASGAAADAAAATAAAAATGVASQLTGPIPFGHV